VHKKPLVPCFLIYYYFDIYVSLVPFFGILFFIFHIEDHIELPKDFFKITKQKWTL